MGYAGHSLSTPVYCGWVQTNPKIAARWRNIDNKSLLRVWVIENKWLDIVKGHQSNNIRLIAIWEMIDKYWEQGLTDKQILSGPACVRDKSTAGYSENDKDN